jgi:arginine decarboxylase-like protein
MLYHKFKEKQKQANPKSSRWKEITNIKAEITESKVKEWYNESMKQKVGSLKR